MQVLYVDDEDDIREIAQLSLSLKTGWDVRTAACGHDMLALVEKAAWMPDVILLDVMMPRMDGPQALSSLRRLPSGEALPVIFITARVLTTERARLMSMGAAGVIAKPFDPMRLAAEVSAIVEHRERA